jgi:hypothetical protein
LSSRYSSSVRRTKPGGGSRCVADDGWFASSSWFFGGWLWLPPSSSGFGELVDLNRGARSLAAGAIWGKWATRIVGLANGRRDSLEQRANWRAEVRNMVAALGGEGGELAGGEVTFGCEGEARYG